MLQKRRFFCHRFWLVVVIMLTIPISYDRASPESKDSPAGTAQLDIDLTIYRIKDPALQKTLRTESIPIRKTSYRLPSMKLPLLELGEFNVENIRPHLETLARKYAEVSLSEAKIKDLNDIITAQVGAKIFWTNKSSGAFAYFDKTVIKPRMLKAFNPCELVRIIFHKPFMRRKWDPRPPPETLDIIFVSQVMDAEIKDGETKPMRQRASEFFVGFGRRYYGIPVVGSRFVVRLGPNGELMGVQETWRPIIGEREKVTIDASSFERRLTAALFKEKVLKPGQSLEKDILILGTAWGYMEGPVGNVQKMMVPGCLVNYRLRTQGSADQTSQIVIPMADVDYPILGTPAYFKTKEASPEKTK